MKPKLLDLFCGAGGCSRGYVDAGFDVIGVDNRPQPHYPYEFIQADALEYLAAHGNEFDAIHASPPCQRFSAMTKRWNRQDSHPDLVEPTRKALAATGRPYVIENVPGAPLINPTMLCGTMFGLQTKYGAQLRRHRRFECSFPVGLVPPCNHKRTGKEHSKRRIPATINVYGHPGGSSRRDSLDFSCFSIHDRRDAMGIDWMICSELSQAIPPAYTRFIGGWLMNFLSGPFTPRTEDVS